MKITLFFSTILFLLFSCQAQDQDFDLGKVDGSTYSNKFFHFTMKIPKSWNVQSQGQTQEMMQSAENLLAGDDQNMKAVLKASKITVANLLVVFQYEVGSPVDYNPGFAVIAENITSSPGIKSGKDYLFHSRKLLERGQMKYSFDKEPYSVIIGGKEFYAMDVSTYLAGMTIKQTYYSTVIDHFTLNFATSYTNEKQKKDLANTLKTVAFN